MLYIFDPYIILDKKCIFSNFLNNTVHYELFVADKLLDSSLERGEPLAVTIGEGKYNK